MNSRMVEVITMLVNCILLSAGLVGGFLYCIHVLLTHSLVR